MKEKIIKLIEDVLSDRERERLGVMAETELWEEESTHEIELCTIKDFEEHWNSKKQRALEEKIAKETA